MAEDKLIFTDEQTKGGRGAWFLGYFLYWGASLKRSIIVLSRLRDQVEESLVTLAWLVAAAGWLAFFSWCFRHYAAWSAQPLSLLFFWRTPDPLALAFLLSLWFDLFLIYRLSETAAARRRINYRLFDNRKKPAAGRKNYNVAGAYGRAERRAIEDAYLLAADLHQTQVTVIHLFRVLLKSREVQNLLIRLNVDAKKLVEMTDRALAKELPATGGGPLVLAPALQEALVLAFTDAYNRRQDSVDALNLLDFCYDHDANLAEILYDQGLDQDKVKNAVAWFRVNRRLLNNYHRYRRLALLKPGTNMNRAYTAIATPTLDHFSSDLTVAAKNGALDLCVGRDKEIKEIFEAFNGGHSGVLLVGPVGVGKNTIVGGLAQLMVEENVPEFLRDRRLVELDVARLVAGADASQAEERLLVSLNEISRSGNIILYINNIEHLIGISAGGAESLDVSGVLVEALNRRNIYCLAVATTEDYTRYIENKPLGNAFTTVGVNEPDTNAAIQILESRVGFLEAKYDIYIVYSALEQSVLMSVRYLTDKYLPRKALDLLEHAAANASRRAKNNPTDSLCSETDVAAVVSELTGIPVSKVTASESRKLLSLETEIHRRLIDQVEAVSAVAAALRRARAELKDTGRPIASFLFLGPTGVGKTELAKSVSEIYFGAEDYMVRLDMSEYQAPDSIRKMIGDVDGTLGYLTEAVRKKPFSLVLLDEFEKANPDILNLFLQMLDDGRLTDGQGRTISFAESIVIATSNIGAVYIQDQLKAGTPVAAIQQELINNQLNKYLRPELINRFDGIIVFKPLSPDDTLAITTLMLKKIKKNLGEKGIDLKADKEGVTILAREGYNPQFGARPLRRLLQDKVEDDIANRILSGELQRRDTVIINSQAQIEIQKAAPL